MSRAGKLRGLTLDWAKAIHDAIGIESPRLFIAAFAIFGLLAFGFAGWIVDHGYRVKLREQTVKAASVTVPPVVAPDAVSVSNKAGHTAHKSNPSIEQRSMGASSPNVVVGDNSHVEINGKE